MQEGFCLINTGARLGMKIILGEKYDFHTPYNILGAVKNLTAEARRTQRRQGERGGDLLNHQETERAGFLNE